VGFASFIDEAFHHTEYQYHAQKCPLGSLAGIGGCQLFNPLSPLLGQVRLVENGFGTEAFLFDCKWYRQLSHRISSGPPGCTVFCFVSCLLVECQAQLVINGITSHILSQAGFS
jgi:hypothetical protein